MAVLSVTCGLMAGCASPGNPKPPTLNLPRIVEDLRAERVGNEVVLRFTAPEKNTDKLMVQGAMTAAVCRQVDTGKCVSVVEGPVRAGENVLRDRLPEGLRGKSLNLLTYKVEVRNSAGRGAGWSAGVAVAGGEAPPVMAGLRVRVRKGGDVLEWAKSEEVFDSVRLMRTMEAQPGEKLTSKESEPAVLEVKTSGGDPGGLRDDGVVVGKSYVYEIERVHVASVNGRELEVLGEPVKISTGVLKDTIPPPVPVGLEAVAGEGSVALSWEPSSELDVKGYVVYRRDAEGRSVMKLTPEVIVAPQFSDSTAVAGRRYVYQVSAVDVNGNESAKSAEVVEGVR